jgi:hypothetical protein
MEKMNIFPKFTVDMKIIEENKKVDPKKVFENSKYTKDNKKKSTKKNK